MNLYRTTRCGAIQEREMEHNMRFSHQIQIVYSKQCKTEKKQLPFTSMCILLQALLPTVSQLKGDLPLHPQLPVEVLDEPVCPLVDVVVGRRTAGWPRRLRPGARRRRRRWAQQAHRPRERRRRRRPGLVAVIVGAVEQARSGGEAQLARHQRRSLEGGGHPSGGIKRQQEPYLPNCPPEKA